MEIPIPLSDIRDASGQLLKGPASTAGPGYGRIELHRFGFFLGHGPIEPGTFVRQVGHWQWEPVPEDSINYRGVALDRSPGPMTSLRQTQVFDPPQHLGYEVWEVDEFKARHTDPKIARIVDLCDALKDEHARFRQYSNWQGSGYLADSQDKCGVAYREGPSGLPPPAPDVEYVRRCEVPMNARRIVSRTGAVYSSHLRSEVPAGFPDAHGLGLAGPLSVAGHLVCLWAVLGDRVRELLRRSGVVREAVHLQRLAACDRLPIDWGDEERGWLEAARAEAQSLVDALGDNRNAHVIARGGDSDDAMTKELSGGTNESSCPALTPNQSLVLRTMAVFDARLLVSADVIAAEMEATQRLSARTIGPIVRKLIELHLAERPEGDRSGARLTTAGRRLASKIAD